MDFVMRLMDLRNQVISLSSAEGCAFDEDMVRKKFVHALSVGFTDDTIRLELRQVLKNPSLPDHELLEEVNLVVQREAEHKKRAKKDTREVKTTVKKVDAGLDEAAGEGCSLRADIQFLNQQVSELMSYTEQGLNNMQNQIQWLNQANGLDGYTSRGGSRGGRGGGRGGFRGGRGGRGGGGFNRGGRGGGFGAGRGGNGHDNQDNQDGDGFRPNRGRGNFRPRGANYRGGHNDGGRAGGNDETEREVVQRIMLKVKCSNCIRDGLFCRHCTECGQLGHRRSNCPSLNE